MTNEKGGRVNETLSRAMMESHGVTIRTAKNIGHATSYLETLGVPESVSTPYIAHAALSALRMEVEYPAIFIGIYVGAVCAARKANGAEVDFEALYEGFKEGALLGGGSFDENMEPVFASDEDHEIAHEAIGIDLLTLGAMAEEHARALAEGAEKDIGGKIATVLLIALDALLLGYAYGYSQTGRTPTTEVNEDEDLTVAAILAAANR